MSIPEGHSREVLRCFNILAIVLPLLKVDVVTHIKQTADIFGV